MKQIKYGRLVCRLLLWVATISLLYGTPWAADFPQRKALQEQSKKNGLGVPSVELLNRVKGPGKNTIEGTLLKRFNKPNSTITTSGPSKKVSKEKYVSNEGKNGWFLEVLGDGTSFHYLNNKALDSKMKLGKPVSQRFTNGQLEQLGHKFISENLKDMVKLGPNEALVPFFTEFQIAGEAPAQMAPADIKEQVVASTIVFSRTINGIHVLGGGSKVAITFANDGSPVGFSVDWPTYKLAGKKQKVLDVNQLQSRAQKLRPLGENASVVRFEAGYFDAGVRKRDQKALVQASAARFAVEKQIVDPDAHKKDVNSGHILVTTVDIVPAGQTVEKDMKWGEAMKIRGEKLPQKAVGQTRSAPSKKK